MLAVSVIEYPAHGWLPAGAKYIKRWDDRGIDFATNWNGLLIAPGKWRAVQISQDASFPNGFGPHYLYVEILDGDWALPHGLPENTGHFYLGHDTAIVNVGDSGERGHPLAIVNQGWDWAGTGPNSGWVELGPAFDNGGTWLPGPKRDHHFYDQLIDTPLRVDVGRPLLHFGMGGVGTPMGLRVMGTSRMLVQMGYMAPGHYKWTFDQEMHLAVKEFRIKHNLCPRQDQRGVDHGIVDDATDALMRQVRDHCRKTGRKDWP